MTLNESDAHKQLELTRNFLELSQSADTCADLRSSDCIQLLVQMLHSNGDGDESSTAARKCASQALHNIVHSHPDEKERQREVKVLRLLDQILDYSNFLRTQLQSGGEAIADDEERHPLAAIKMLMKISFDDEHRHTMCELGALKAIPNLVHLDHAVHGPAPGREQCNSMRSYALMALTNLTFGDENVHNKAYLCGQKQFMEVIIAQLDTAPDDLLQVTAGVLRNLSWRADKHMKTIFNELGTVTALALAAMKNKSENTLKAILSALWNLSAHCSTNKAEFCAVDGALAFLVKMLSYEGPSKTLKIIENAGGILRNVSSHIAVCEPYRQILREHNCLAILLQQLKSESLTVVSNSCGTLWNLSARCPEDQKFLLDHNAITQLRTLVTSKNSMIAEGSASALKNLINFRAALELPPTFQQLEGGTLPRRYSSMRLSNNPTGSLKKASGKRSTTPTATTLLPRKCESRESLYSGKSDSKHSSKSDSVYEQRKLSTAKSHFEMAPSEEQPIDYSMKYSEDTSKPAELDLDDQLTDFSARYNEQPAISITPKLHATNANEGSSEILLILDGASTQSSQMLVKAVSASDLSGSQAKSASQRPSTLNVRSSAVENLAPANGSKKKQEKSAGSHTPELSERPINYCEEGTPRCFSRYDSMNSLTDVAALAATKQSGKDEPKASSKPATNLPMPTESAMETPLMFSRRSSMDSLVNDETIVCDDNGSVISDYSRLQSGVISPSELPDSPTQSMPQSPKVQQHAEQLKQPHQSLNHIFEDKLSNFHVEHTPAVFSCATSLSNLSLLADEQQPQQFQRGSKERQTLRVHSNDIENDLNGNQQNTNDEPRSYCTEDTPALLSKACSNSNLSMLSLNSNVQEQQLETQADQQATTTTLRSDMAAEDAITKMRCGGRSYLPVNDEMNKYFVEDSPCNFSVVSGLSSLTVGSAQVGPARVLKDSQCSKPQLMSRSPEQAPKLPPRRAASHMEPRLPPKRHDSLSSLSIESDDDSNLLNQAIAAGSGGSKFSRSSHTNTLPKPSSNGSNSQRRQTATTANLNGAKTDYSSDDSLDDGQSKSLFEQCILSGMRKSSDALLEETSGRSTSTAPRMSKDERLLTECINTGITKCAGGERFVSSQVRQIESMLASRPHGASSSTQAAAGTQQSRRHHWV